MTHHTNGTMPPANGMPFHQQYPQNYHQHGRLDPAVPHFTPNGTELARFKPPTPPGSNMDLIYPSNLSDVERYIIETRTKHDKELAHVNSLAKDNKRAIEETNEKIARDLQTLQAQLAAVQLQVGPCKNKDHAMAVIKRGLDLVDPDDVRPEVMLKHFDREIVAQVYLEQADVAESAARKLRADAIAITGGSDLANVSLEDEQVNGNSTPTQAPARRAQTEKQSHAVEIKVPTTINDKEEESPNDDIKKQTTLIEIKDIPWQPLSVRTMPPSPILCIPATHTQTFTWEFLTSTFGGKKHSPSFYFIPTKTSLLKSRGYWILEAEYEPFLPVHPGQHGAKLTPFFNDTVDASEMGEGPDEENYLDTPVFVSKVGEGVYTYFGQYSQLRFSDKLDYERVMETVPERIRRYWANQLADPLRPAWVTKALKEHFWPRPKYEGPTPTDSAVATPATAETGGSRESVGMEKRVKDALVAYAEELKQWERNVSVKVSCLTSEGLMEAFAKADAEMEPGMRLWWEYFECVGYQVGFYEWLVEEQKKFEERASGKLDGGVVGVGGGRREGLVDAAAEKGESEGSLSGRADQGSAEQILDWEEDAEGNFTADFRPADSATPNPPNNTKPAAKLTAKARTPSQPQTRSCTSSTATSTIKPSAPKPTPTTSTPKPTQVRKASTTSTSPPKQINGSLRTGDLAAARAFQASATPAKPRGIGSGSRGGGGAGNARDAGGRGMYTPPHRRGGGAK
ncbi:hypothetical protein LTR78_001578 [Recurvomyces mirabilis]|uniref:DUF6697 domain-containing protein n=1 Tax=Recurvomyces mirabilis TaxID=574656 RepID=A0AAE0WUW8_9PEZI|nr:hypothetical protein LTR78_001578 [Recurvomyces mirabilis]KAK5151849.1 hypothetical protein LTS14_008983 [Recurvomyces mirabilis]